MHVYIFIFMWAFKILLKVFTHKPSKDIVSNPVVNQQQWLFQWSTEKGMLVYAKAVLLSRAHNREESTYQASICPIKNEPIKYSKVKWLSSNNR